MAPGSSKDQLAAAKATQQVIEANADALRDYQKKDDKILRQFWPGKSRRELLEKLEHFRKLPKFFQDKQQYLESEIGAAKYDEEELKATMAKKLQEIHEARNTISDHVEARKQSERDLELSNFKGFIQECYKSNDMQKVLQEVHDDFSGRVSPIDQNWMDFVTKIDAIDRAFSMFEAI